MRNHFAFLDGRVIGLLMMSFLIPACSNETVEPQLLGEYIFLERTIITTAIIIEADSSPIPVLCVEPSMFYTFDTAAQTLTYRSGMSNALPITQELKLIVGDNHFYLAPLAGCNGGTIWLTPIYFLPLWIDPTFQVIEMSAERVGMWLEGVETEILLAPGEAFSQVTTRLDSVLQVSGNWATLEYTDSVSLTNFGPQPKENVIWNSLGTESAILDLSVNRTLSSLYLSKGLIATPIVRK